MNILHLLFLILNEFLLFFLENIEININSVHSEYIKENKFRTLKTYVFYSYKRKLS